MSIHLLISVKERGRKSTGKIEKIDMKLFLSEIFASVLMVTFVAVSGSPIATSGWGYKSGYNFSDPAHWKDSFPTCGGSSQSPIDVTSRYAQYSENLKPISISGMASSSAMVSLEKHATSAYLNFGDQWNIMLNERTCLKPMSIHWHWGSDAGKGSEHLMDGTQFPIEGHVISFNCNNYTTFDLAKSAPNGLYVFGIFYEIGSDGSALQAVFDAIDPLVSGSTTNVTIHEISLRNIFPQDLKNYYQYDGSLTTPPCTENVKWTIMKTRMTITNEQINKLRHLTFEAPEVGVIVNNFRPVNPLNSRTLYSSFKSGAALKWSSAIISLQLGGILLFTMKL